MRCTAHGRAKHSARSGLQERRQDPETSPAPKNHAIGEERLPLAIADNRVFDVNVESTRTIDIAVLEAAPGCAFRGYDIDNYVEQPMGDHGNVESKRWGRAVLAGRCAEEPRGLKFSRLMAPVLLQQRLGCVFR
jgi:hypothetical protein